MIISPGRRARMVALVLISGLLFASCGCEGVPQVQQLGLADGMLVALVVDDFDGTEITYTSGDGGLTWDRNDAVGVPAESPSCEAGTCFRVSGSTVEVQDQAGAWSPAWSIPIDRSDYVRSRGGGFLGCGTGGVDMEFTSDVVATTRSGDVIGVVGMGDQGVVLVDSEGLVDRIGVTYLAPTPFTQGFAGYGFEMLLAAIGAALLAALLSAIALASTRRAQTDGRGRVALALGLIAPLVIALLAFVEPSFAAGLLFVIPIGLIAAWIGVARAVPGHTGSLLGMVLGATVGSFLIALAPFELWARGVFDSYTFVGRLALIAGFAAVIGSIGWVRIVSVRAAQALPVEPIAVIDGRARTRDTWRDPFTFDG